MSFASSLNQTATIQSKSLETEGYEQVEDWVDLEEDVPCRKDDSTNVKIDDTNIRLNTDEALFFFMPTVNIIRGNRILLDGDLYDVVKVAKLYARSSLHHLEVLARFVDHD